MKIHKENIEEFMFDYFEGNLSDADKQQVLDFVHEYPEYEKDFVLWAKSYAHIGEPAPNYKLTNGLIQQGNKVQLQKYYWSVPILILAALSFWWFSYRQEPNHDKITKSEVLKSNTVAPQAQKGRSDAPPSSPISQKLEGRTAPTLKVNTTEDLSPSVSEIGQVGKALNDEKTESVQDIVPIAPLKQQDTVDIANRHETRIDHTQSLKDSMASSKSISSEKEPAPVKKKKKRNPIDLNTSPKFIEQNPNF